MPYEGEKEGMKMSHSDSDKGQELTRREFVQVTSAAAAGTALVGWLPGRTEAVEKYPHWGEVVVVRNEAATDGPNVRAEEVRVMLDGALRRFTNTSSLADVWDHLLPGWQEDHLIAIKVNAIERRLAHPEVAYAIAASLTEFGVPENNIIIYDRRLGSGLAACRYTVNTGSEGVRCFYNMEAGWGYDDDHSVKIGSYTQKMSTILTRSDHLINVPVLKRLGGYWVVSLSMKNHFGTTSYPADLHDPFATRCAELNAHEAIKDKTRLIVIDALFGGTGDGPAFVANSLILSADTVAADTVGTDMIIEGLGIPMTVPLLGKAVEMGLGASPEEIQKVSLYAGTQVGGVLSATTVPDVTVVGRSTPLEVRVVLDASGEDVGSPGRMSVDLSSLGIASELPLEHAGGGRYTAGTTITPSQSGQYPLPVTLETGEDEPLLLFAAMLKVYPDGDRTVHEDGLGSGWSVEVSSRAESDLTSSRFVRSGSFSHAISVKAGGTVKYVFDDPEGIDLFGYTHLEFHINGGEASGQNLGIAGRKLSDLGIVPQSDTWTLVSIPVSELPLDKGRLTDISIVGYASAGFYIDDMKLVAAEPPEPTAVEMVGERMVPSAYGLSPNYPNPFNAETTVPYELPRSGVVRLSLYNTTGQQIRVLVEGGRSAGTHLAMWDGRDDAGRDVASGVYMCRMEVDGNAVGTRRMTLVR